jgi:hypothetical protein
MGRLRVEASLAASVARRKKLKEEDPEEEDPEEFERQQKLMADLFDEILRDRKD